MELMVAVAVIGILTAVVIPSYLSSKARSRDAIRLGDLKSISLAIQNSWQESGYTTWPQSLSDISSYFNGVIPTDPSDHSQYLYTPYSLDRATQIGNDPSTQKKDFCLGTKMEVISATTTCNMQDAYAQGKSYPTGYNYTYVGP